jgi:L-gulonolactone oxidase
MKASTRPLWRNWNRNLSGRPARLLRPETVDDMIAAVRAARRTGRTIRPVGSSYSYTPLALTDGDMISLDRIAGVEDVDLAAGTAVVRGGTRLDRMIAELARHGAAIEGPGDIDRQTIAGATATGTHGTGLGLSSLSSQIMGLTVVDGRGELRTLDAATTPDLFDAARIALGTFGIVAAVKFRVLPLYHVRIERGPATLAAVLANLDAEIGNNRNFEFYWFPNNDLVYYKRMNIAETGGGSRYVDRAVRWIDDYLVENALVGMSCAAVRRWPHTRRTWLQYGRRLAPETTTVLSAAHAYPSVRLLRHHETEYAIPLARAREFIDAFQARLRVLPVHTMIPIEFRFVAAEDIPLSPSYGRDVMYVAVHAHHREDFAAYFAACEDLLKSFDGRPHWGKMHSLDGAALQARYPRWDDFISARRQMDPDGIFLNPYLRDVLQVA